MSGLARSSHRALIFQRDLTRTITLTDGRQVKSLHDARTVLLDVSVNARSGALDHAIRFLLLAAETGRRRGGGDRADRARVAGPALAGVRRIETARAARAPERPARRAVGANRAGFPSPELIFLFSARGVAVTRGRVNVAYGYT
jgi:hypothetical protein